MFDHVGLNVSDYARATPSTRVPWRRSDTA